MSVKSRNIRERADVTGNELASQFAFFRCELHLRLLAVWAINELAES